MRCPSRAKLDRLAADRKIISVLTAASHSWAGCANKSGTGELQDAAFAPPQRTRSSLNDMSLHPHGAPSPAPCSGPVLEHAGAELTARCTASVRHQVPGRKVVPVTPNQPGLASMAVG